MNPFRKINRLLKKYNKIILLTHKNPDIDGFGSILFFTEYLRKKDCFILVSDNKDITIQKIINTFNNFNVRFITEEDCDKLIDNDTLILVLDVHKKSLLEFPNIVDKTKNVVIIDHHIISNGLIKDKIFAYIDTNYSSVSEMVVDYAIYNRYKMSEAIATILLAGIEIDTNSYNANTTSETFDACSYLLKCGANIALKQELLKENKDLYIKKQYFIKRSYMVNDKVAFCILDYHVYDSKFLAILADELLQFENVKASFVIGYIGKKKVGISARSIGEINVAEIMSRFGGGGHSNNAACQIERTTISKVTKDLSKIIKEEII